MRPRLLDLFCCAGGAARGYQRAGFEVIGVDIAAQPRYRGDRFVEADCIAFLDRMIAGGTWDWIGPGLFAAVHASPPCTAHTPLAAMHGDPGTGWLLQATLDALAELPIPWVVENVSNAKMRCDLMLCGTEFDLSVVTADGQRRWLRRHRKFAASFPLMSAGGCRHEGKPVVGVYGTGGGGQMTRGYKADRREACEVMGMPWASRAGVSLAIPPIYAQFVGEQLRDYLAREVAA